jgi:PKD domain/Secretion system C-terminal sorting domain
MRLFYCFLLFIIGVTFANCQQLHDNVWFFGYSNNPDTFDKFGITELNFETGNLHLFQNPSITAGFDGTHASYADEKGNLLLFTNGAHLFDKTGGTMQNGQSIMDGNSTDGQVIFQYSAILPNPKKISEYFVIYQNYQLLPLLDVFAKGLYFARVDSTGNNGLGKVIEKKKIILEDTLWLGKIIPVRHANGRDWWLLMNELFTNRFYRILIDPLGFNIIGVQDIGLPITNGDGQSYFSPDGTKFCSFNGIGQNIGSFLDIYDFDRCTGLLSNHLQVNEGNNYGGVSISPNSKYLYESLGLNIYQYDLTAFDILGSKTLIDTWDGTITNLGFATGFYAMQLAPDGKIYVATVSASDKLHVIHNPDEAGVNCQMQQHGIKLPTYNGGTMPNFPNFRLGSLDGSPCDTLGLDNKPQAWFRMDKDTLDAFHFNFHDLSYFEPSNWSWNFGDGLVGSNERHPEHHFANKGVFNVCLTVQNQYGSDTFCRTMFIGVTNQKETEKDAAICILPNPFANYLNIVLNEPFAKPIFKLFNQLGQLVLQKETVLGANEVNTAILPKGVYFWEFTSNGLQIKNGKLIK